MATNCEGILSGWETVQVTEYFSIVVAAFAVKSAFAKKFGNLLALKTPNLILTPPNALAGFARTISPY